MQKRWVVLATSAVLALSTSSAWGWNRTGHMIVAQIAYKRLTPTVKVKVDQLLASTIPAGSTMTAENAFLEAAHWTDDVRKNDKKYGKAHAIHLPYSIDGKTRTYVQAPADVVRALNELTTEIKDPKVPDTEKTDMLRNIIHFCGDIHMPLHCIVRYSEAHPDGDGVGSLVLLPGTDVNLHHLWDCGLNEFKSVHNPARPLEYAYINDFATTLCTKYPVKSYKEEKVTNFMSWAQESHKISIDTVYVGITDNVAPSKEYIEKNIPVAEKRVTLAGYRLADVLNRILK